MKKKVPPTYVLSAKINSPGNKFEINSEYLNQAHFQEHHYLTKQFFNFLIEFQFNI